MATYKVQSPDGATYQIDGPDDADPSDVIKQVMGIHQSNPVKAESPAAQGNTLQVYNPFGNNFDTGINLSPNVNNFLAGAGKASTDLVRGIKQLGAHVGDFVDPRQQTLSGLISGQQPQSRVDDLRQQEAEARRLDKPLMDTKAGLMGDIAGTTVDALPAMFIPGANTYAGSALIGSGLGLLQPTTSGAETAKNVGQAAVLSPLSLLGGRLTAGALNGLKSALWDPFTEAGQSRIASQVMKSFAGGDQEAAQAAQNITQPRAVLPGVQPTTAELADNAGLAQLQKNLSANPEYLQQFTGRAQGNRAAMTGALQDIAGGPAGRADAVAARSAASTPLYQTANDVRVPVDSEMSAMLRRPSMQSAMQRAEQLAAERGDSLQNSAMVAGAGAAPSQQQLISGKALQYLKMSLSDMANSGAQTGMGSHELGALKSTLNDLNSWTQKNVPELRAADAAYAGASKPINQMDVGQQLYNKLVPALGDFGSNARLNAASYVNAAGRNADQIAADVTGNSNAKLSDILTESQMKNVRQIGEQLARTANAAELGAPKGSPTAQNLIGQNVLRQFLGPMGLPGSMGERMASGALGRTIARPLDFMTRAAEPNVMQALSAAALNPQTAARLLGPNATPAMRRLLAQRAQSLLGNVSASNATGLLGNSPQ